MLYDEDTEVFINGVLAFSVKGFSKKYREVSISSEARKTLKKGDNILAVHCWNDGGGQAIDVGLVIPSKNDPPKETFIPDFVDVFKKTGVQIVHLAEFHNHLGPKRHNAEDSLRLLKAMHDECARLSNENFLLLPGEEPNVHLGGHWISFFPRPVMWVLKRAANKPFIEDHPEYGRVYHLGSSQDVLKKYGNDMNGTAAATDIAVKTLGFRGQYLTAVADIQVAATKKALKTVMQQNKLVMW